jgi:uncharacterized membrane protein YgdD (TMEM256/DUF423 family)
LYYIIAVFLVLTLWLEVPRLWKRRAFREMLIVGLLLVLGSLYGVAVQQNSTWLWNPNQVMYYLAPLAQEMNRALNAYP